MAEMLLSLARKYLVNYLHGKKIENETIHPWRKDWKYIVLHSFRVEKYATKIIESEVKKLSQEEIILIRLASILHDIGRIDNREQHAKIGRNIVQNWINNDVDKTVLTIDSDELLQMILDHPNKNGNDKNYKLAILKDADALDEVGIMNIFMAGNRIEKEDPFFFNKLLERIKDYELDFSRKVYKNLNTETAKRIITERITFQKNAIIELEKELMDIMEIE